MLDIFSPSANDQSIFYLQKMFGNVGTVLPLGIDTISAAPLLGAMFKTFNSVILAVGALIVVYITIVGVLKTAQEGEVLGKQWSSLWIPLRTVIGVAALIPSSAGYCAIQIIMMWIIVQGVGAADTLWGTALGWIQLNGNPIGAISKAIQTPVSAGTQATMQQLFQGLVCQASAAATYTNPNPGSPSGGYYCAISQNSSGSFCTSGNAFNAADGSQYKMGPNGVCGTLTYCDVNQACSGTNSNSFGCASCKGQVAALQTIVPGMSYLAQLLVNADYEYRLFYNTSYNQSTAKVPQWMESYCQDKPVSQCCVPTNNPNLQATQTCGGSSADFYNLNGASTQDASKEAIGMYWKYVLQPELSQSGFNTADFVAEAVSAYHLAINNELAPLLQQQAQNTELSKTFEEAKKNGWILAGGYYYAIAKVGNKAMDSTLPSFKISGSPAGANNELSNYRVNYTAASDLVSAAIAQAQGASGSSSNSSSAGGSLPSEMGGISAAVGSVGGDIIKSFMSTVSGTNTGKNMAGVSGTGSAQGITDPIVKVQLLGHGLLIAVEVIFFVVLILNLVLSIVGYISVFALGTGVVNPIGPALTTINMFFLPVLLGFMVTFFTFGGLLAVYTPLIPYIIFTFGAMGWFIATIEAMVAGPLVALGIIMPGHHELLGKGEKALALIFGIFLRPSLMIFGMIAGMILSAVIATLINTSFYGVMMTISRDPTISELIFFMAAYIFMIITALNKSFALIYLIPDRVLTWIGEQASSHGEAEALGETKRGVEGAGQGGAGVYGGASSPSNQAAGGIAGQNKVRQKEKADLDKKSAEGKE